jgi:DNA-binding LytR/AlgR family response regulator
MTYVLADDELIYRELVQQYLSAIPDLICLKVCENAFEVNAFLVTSEPDLLILDVEMPGLSGLNLVKSLSKMPYVIFISSHPNYALDAFEVDAVDFIKKPIPPERLLRAIEKVRQLIKVRKAMAHQENFKTHDNDSFFIREDGAFVRIKYNEVLYVESLSDFVKLHLVDGTEKLVLVNLKNLEQQLPTSQFLRISRTFMVNKQQVTSVGNGSVHLNKIQLPIGVTYAETIVSSIVGDQAIKRHIV